MGLGVENSVNSYNQNYRYQQNKTTGQANHLDFNKILSAKEGANTEKVQKPNENSGLIVIQDSIPAILDKCKS